MGSRRTYDRDSAEFVRALGFTDALFAIAMTLLVVGIAVPSLHDGDSVHDLAEALNDLLPEFISFFISFAVIGRYWLAHHVFFGLLTRIDQGLIGLNLLYLVGIAFLPFPTALLGELFENPLSIAIYAVNVAIVSGMEVVMFRHAYRNGLLRKQPPPNIYRWGMWMSFSPVILFMASIPVAFVSTSLAAGVWALAIPLGIWASRHSPEGTSEYLVEG